MCVFFRNEIKYTTLLYNARPAENVALHKVTCQQQKIGYGPGISLWSSQNAVDGAKECSIEDSRKWTLSGYAIYPWWQVDLRALYDISYITIYGRADGGGIGR